MAVILDDSHAVYIDSVDESCESPRVQLLGDDVAARVRRSDLLH